ncbi:FmdB family zinc ribbon protein [Chloroflexota bacterium]
MPTYEYECDCCSLRFERKQSFSDNSIVSCPQCGSNPRRLFSRVPVIFKGSGFYITDSRQNHGNPSSNGNTDNAKADNAKADNAKADNAKADNAKADNAKADNAKADNAKADNAKADNVESKKDTSKDRIGDNE